jgi:hypothetical protein
VVSLQQIGELREEERSESCWFVLPDEGDDDVNWFAFTVEVEGPVSSPCGVGCGGGTTDVFVCC